jgi:protein-S-isoprenylcysteine O-methyltransferase Ste14
MKQSKNGEHPFGDIGQIICFAVFIVIWSADSFIFHYSTFLSKYIHIYIRAAVSLAVFAGIVKLLKSSHNVIHEEAAQHLRLLTGGVYGFVRHPMYMGVLLFYESLIILTFSLISLAFYLLIFLFYNYIAGYEEKILIEKYGEEYILYKKQTGRWIPR